MLRRQSFSLDFSTLPNITIGFRENYYIDHALISITEDIWCTLDGKRYGCGIFIDLQMAFDTVNHDILLKKLDIIV